MIDKKALPKDSPDKNRSNNTATAGYSYRWKTLTGEVLYILITVLLIKTCIAGPYTVPTGSMEKTILVGDYMFVNQFIYGIKTPPNIPLTDIHLPRFTLFPAIKEPQHGDIVVFVYPGNRDELQSDEVTYYIKRCVGTPGDVVEVRNKILYVNGEKFPTWSGMQFINPVQIPKDRYYPDMFPRNLHWNPDNYGPLHIPKKGDVIPMSAENFAQWSIFIEREGHVPSLRNSVVYVDNSPAVSYTVERNYYFMMGDNRDNSEDSRYWGFVPEDNIVGQPMFLYWSWDADKPLGIFDKLASIRWSRIGKSIQ